MRIGTNPEKGKHKTLKYKFHRVIMPVYIPEEDNYFKDAFAVFKKSIQSVLRTIDSEKTDITIINNSCKSTVTDYINKLLHENLIDKHICYSENKGKVYTVLQEARSSFEDFVTIVDADVFFFNNWENEVFKLFQTFKKVGVIGLSPTPNTAFYCNTSLLVDKVFSIKWGNVVDIYDLELFEKGINKKDFFVTDRINWKIKQYYIEHDNVIAIVGAGHFASTYKASIFRKMTFEKPVFRFPGGELDCIDKPIDALGYYRISLPKAYVYHMGNTLTEHLDLEQLKNEKLEERSFKKEIFLKIFPGKLKRIIAAINRKIFLNNPKK